MAVALATAVVGAFLLERSASGLRDSWEDLRESSELESELDDALAQLRQAWPGQPGTDEDAAQALEKLSLVVERLPPSEEASKVRIAVTMLSNLNPGDSAQPSLELLDTAHAELRDAEHIRQSDRYARELSTLRWIILGQTLGFVLLINALLAMIVRASRLIIEPVENLVQATRSVAQGEYDVRVDTDVGGELDALASAFNTMAGELAQAEANRLETMRQAAVTINHELNNAIAALDMQLDLIARDSARGRSIDAPIDRAREAIGRIGRTTESLRKVRRIVLTQYAGGETMLDLTRSSEADDSSSA